MTISIQIHIPDSEIAEGQHALNKRMAVLGFAFGRAAVPVIAGHVHGEGEAAGPTEALRGGFFVGPSPFAEARSKTSEAPNGQPDSPGIPEGTAPAKKTRAKKAEPAPNISTQPEARVDPEVEAQDEADEAAEVAASAPASEVVTAEMLRAEMGAYAQKFGMDAALADGSKVFTDALGQAPEGGWKLSVVAGIGGETLAKAVAAWRAAAAGSARYGEGK